MTWKPPATTSLSSDDVSNIVDGLRTSDRDRALAFLDNVEDVGLLYVVACELAYYRYLPDAARPSLGLDADSYRAFIRDATTAADHDGRGRP